MTPPFYPQETGESCVPACIRMVLAYWGVELTESYLRDCCLTTSLGTSFIDAASCIRQLDLKADSITNATISDLRLWLVDGYFPVVSLNLFPLTTKWAAHAVVVVAVGESTVTYLDPLWGQRTSDLVPFEQAWQMRRGKALLVNK